MTITVLLMSSSDWPPKTLSALRQHLSGHADWTLVDGVELGQISHQIRAIAPNQTVVAASPPMLIDALTIALTAWPDRPPCAISLVGPIPNEAELKQLLKLGLSGWWPDEGLSTQALLAGLTLDRLRWQRDTAHALELTQVRDQLSDRKWVDRAKGVLAQARGLDEDEAFRLLRGAAMQAQLKIGEVSRSVIEASAWAEALNRAGQLRMLSQRVVKLAAQGLAGVDVHRARKLQEASAQRVQTNLDALTKLPSASTGQTTPDVLAAALAQTQTAWAALSDTLSLRKSPALLKQADDKADALLMHAEALVGQLEVASHRRALKVVNLCGRQRMLAQRLAKDALLADLLDDERRRAGLIQTMSEFESALLELELAPLSSPEIREALKTARDEWMKLLYGVRTLDKSEGRLAICRASEVLLDVFDGLTELYERSLQVIMS